MLAVYVELERTYTALNCVQSIDFSNHKSKKLKSWVFFSHEIKTKFQEVVTLNTTPCVCGVMHMVHKLSLKEAVSIKCCERKKRSENNKIGTCTAN